MPLESHLAPNCLTSTPSTPALPFGRGGALLSEASSLAPNLAAGCGPSVLVSAASSGCSNSQGEPPVHGDVAKWPDPRSAISSPKAFAVTSEAVLRTYGGTAAHAFRSAAQS